MNVLAKARFALTTVGNEPNELLLLHLAYIIFCMENSTREVITIISTKNIPNSSLIRSLNLGSAPKK
jgi:hypothetical protein